MKTVLFVFFAIFFFVITSNTFAQSKTCNKLDNKDRCLEVITAIGPISTEPQAFVRSVFSIVLGLAGGIALLLLMFAGYRMMSSQGNAEQITASREQFTSAIIGLLFIIFSFVILQIIGVEILRIPGFQP